MACLHYVKCQSVLAVCDDNVVRCMYLNKHHWLAASYLLCASVCMICSVVQSILLFLFCRCLLDESGICRRLTNSMGCFVFGIVASTIFLITLVHQLHCLIAYGSFRVNSTNGSSMTTSEFDEIFRK